MTGRVRLNTSMYIHLHTCLHQVKGKSINDWTTEVETHSMPQAKTVRLQRICVYHIYTHDAHMYRKTHSMQHASGWCVYITQIYKYGVRECVRACVRVCAVCIQRIYRMRVALVCMYVCMYVFKHNLRLNCATVQKDIQYVHTYIHFHTYIQYFHNISIHIYNISIHIHTYTHACMRILTHVCMRIPIFVSSIKRYTWLV